MTYLENSKQFDPVRPGEQWFFYWKTSPALWEGRIQQIPPHEVVFLPIYWGLHGDSVGEWDFGNIHPERDLYRLAQLLTHHGRKFCWILPMTPAPFLPNGGVPVFSARTLSISKEGVHFAVLDQEANLNKIFSFFEPKVFGAYSGFLKAFGAFLSEKKIRAPLWGVRYFYFQDGGKQTYLEDYSIAFEQGFSRYLKQNHPEGPEISRPREESLLKQSFTNEVGQLFVNSAEGALAPFWAGTQDVVMLGGSPGETILRSLPGGKSQLEYTRDLFGLFTNSEWISTALLNPSEKKEILKSILNEHFGSREIEGRFKFENYGANLTSEFRPYGIIDTFGKKLNNHYDLIGLRPYLNTHFKWLYQQHEELNFSPEWIDLHHEKIKIFHGEELTRISFGQVLKLFLMGQMIILDRSGLPEGLDRKLQIFLIENNIKTQSVNFMTPTLLCELGEGRLIIFEGDKLIKHPSREKFWHHVFKFLNLVQPQILMDDDVFSLWRIRSTTTHELSYLDVRRVNLYNPTSYKKSVTIKTQKHFAFMRLIDPTRATARSTPQGVDVELLPNGKIALDFGHYEEK